MANMNCKKEINFRTWLNLIEILHKLKKHYLNLYFTKKNKI